MRCILYNSTHCSNDVEPRARMLRPPHSIMLTQFIPAAQSQEIHPMKEQGCERQRTSVGVKRLNWLQLSDQAESQPLSGLIAPVPDGLAGRACEVVAGSGRSDCEVAGDLEHHHQRQ